MEVYTRSRTSRYVIDEDFIPKATIDGEPHEIMTLVAGVSGIIAAIIILAVLMIFIGCKDSERPPSSTSSSKDEQLEDVVVVVENDNILRNNFPLVLDIKTLQSERKSNKTDLLEVPLPNVLNCYNLSPGKYNKAFTIENNELDQQLNTTSIVNAENKMRIPSVIVEKL